MHGADLILMLAAGLGAALIFGYFTQRLGLSPIVGYLIAGVLVGPHTPGFEANTAIAEQLAEVGVILIMFGVGLGFHLEELLAVRRIAIPGALIGMAAATALGAGVAQMFGWPLTASVVFGLTLSVASTVVLVRVLSDAHKLHTPVGHIAMGWLVMEDVLTVLALVLLPTLAAGQFTVASVATDITVAVAKVGGLAVFAAIVGRRFIPSLLDRVAATRSRELFTLSILVIALGIAVGAAMLFGVSMALGAFAAGMVVNRSDYSLRAASEALPMRDAFAVLFFVSVGMLLDPSALLDQPWLFAAALAVVVVGKPLVVGLMLAVMRYPLRIVLTVPVRAGADRRVFVHPRRCRHDARRAPRDCHRHHRRGVDRVHRDQSAGVAVDRTGRTCGGPNPSASGGQWRRWRNVVFAGSADPRHRDRLRADGPHGDATASREWNRAHCG